MLLATLSAGNNELKIFDGHRTTMSFSVSMLVVAVCLSHVQPAASLTDADRRLLDAVVTAARERGDIPGVAVSIVNGSSVLVEAGYGVANVSSGQLMNADTLLPLGSTTKAFTTALLALLIDKHATDAVKSVSSSLSRPSFPVLRK